jgi:hypothetical protein
MSRKENEGIPHFDEHGINLHLYWKGEREGGKK